MSGTDQLVTVTEAASMLGVSRRTVLRRIASGQIPARKLGDNTSGYVMQYSDLPADATELSDHPHNGSDRAVS